ncbi:MAG: efflux RND transporter periplasmic adaptor subunit [Planctomycetes bacterium]|nr:efflux RND transporter periplasmic adaptor subunit [Planctomycetota bacterium]MBL7044740.1 efflux RND transporter periplasmic adaptor subunit [Pirellulaceae bacterium]
MAWRSNLAAVRRFAGSVIVAGVLLASAAVAQAHENHAPLPTKGVTIAGDTIMLSDKARKAIGLTTAKVELDDIHRTVTVNSRVELPWHAQAMITSLVPGKIDQVLVRPGETVAHGQELARVVSTELASLQLALLQARAEVGLARKLLDQRTTLDQQGVIAGKTLLEAQATLAEKSAALEIARQKLLALGLDDATIRQVEQDGQTFPHVSIISPLGGIITHADVRIGQAINATDHLYHVVDPSTVWIVGDVLESDVQFLEKGQPVEASFAALPGKKLQGRIDHLRQKMNRQTRTLGVVIAVENPGGHLRPGMFGRVRISVQVKKEAIVCPTDTVVRSRTGAYLLVQRIPGKYENRLVKLGLTEGENVEVLDGAFPGDQVVLVGNALLAALLGNEHKARVGGDPVEEPEQTHQGVISVALGTIELPTDQQSLATPQIEGRVHRILVTPGQQVAAGDVLAEVDSLQLRNIQLDLLQTLAQARLAENWLEQVKALGGQGVVPKREMWERQSKAETLRLQAETVKRQLAFLGLAPETIERLERVDLTQPDSATNLVKTVPVRAAASGRIVSLNLVPGQVVHPGEALFEIHDLSRVWVKGYVYERDAARVGIGQPARVQFAAFPDLEASGNVVRISPLMDENERVLPVWVEVANPDHLLKDGMMARVTLLAKPTGDDVSAGVARLAPIETVK